MIRIVEAPEIYSNPSKPTLFLAGGITNCPDWQKELINILIQTKYQGEFIQDLIIYNPRRRNFPINIPGESERQITWEYDYLKSSDIISFWFSRGSLNPIVLYELGMWGNSSVTPIVIGMDPEYERQNDVIIQTRLARPAIRIVYSLKDMANEIVKMI